MIDTLLRVAVERRHAVLALLLALALFAGWSARALHVDAVPDLTNVQVQITTPVPGATPLEVERAVTQRLEGVLTGLPGLESTRSQSRYALSQLTVVFREGTDLYFARSLIAERLASVRAELPAGIEPRLGPVATGLGEILLYAITAGPEARRADGEPWRLSDTRELQDWVIRPQLQRLPGVSEINTNGGEQRQVLVAPDPGRMLAQSLSLAQLAEAIQRGNANVGAGYIEKNGEQVLIRVPGQLADEAALAQLVIARRNGRPLRVGDVATVGYGHGLRTGAALIDGEETVIGTVIMRVGENSRTVARAAAAKLAEIDAQLPAGVHATVVYDRSRLVDRTIATVRDNLAEGALLVIAVLFLMLGSVRAALITAAVIPLAMLATFAGMVRLGISANLMSLGALDFGLIVDGAVIIVENAARRLALAQAPGTPPLPLATRLELAYAAAREVIRPSLFGVLVITLVYLPILAFGGAEGKLYRPMAATVMLALVAALLLCLSFVPAAVALWLRPSTRGHQSEPLPKLGALYARWLDRVLARPLPILAAAALLVAGCGWLATRLGTEFMPSLDEGDVLIEVRRIPGTSLTQGLAIEKRLDAALAQPPEVLRVFSQAGTSEAAIDPTAPGEGETYVILKPRAQWPDPARAKADVVRTLQAAAASVPGSVTEFSQPVALRINELLSGVRSALAVKVQGDDLEQLARLAAQVQAIVARVPGASDVKLEQTDGLPLLSVEPRRDVLARYGLEVAELQRTVAGALAGLEAGELVQGDRRYPIVVRLPDALRADLPALARLPVLLPPEDRVTDAPGYVPLAEVARLALGDGPNQISRENGKRRVVVTANVEGRDLGGFVREVRARLATELRLPTGIWLGWGGTYEQLLQAQARLAVIVPATLAAILALLWFAFGSVRDALLIFSGVPLALTGGVLALAARGLPLSVTAAVGFIALSGVAILNGLVMLSFIHALRRDGHTLAEAIRVGARLRLRPVLMTALVASLGFLPMALNHGVGAEVQRPLATVVIGGILSSTLLTLFVLPLLYRLAHRAR